VFRRAVTAAGIQAITPHDLRHTCSSLAVSAGVNMLALQRMLGHQSAKVTFDTYADLFDDDLENVSMARVRAEGLEPSSSFEHGHLKPARLPISPRPHAQRSYRSERAGNQLLRGARSTV
jgi:hypothetical protein